MTESFTIIVQQLPPAECSPNSRVHWSVKKRAGDVYGLEVFLVAKQAWGNRTPLNEAEISIGLVVKQRRRRDLDNWWARFKPGMDALVRAGILVDDDMEHLQHGTFTVLVDAKLAPQTILTIKRGRKTDGTK